MSWASMPMVIDVPSFRLRACRFGRKPVRAIAVSTARRLASVTRAVPLTMRETVLTETPASRATSVTVTIADPMERVASLGAG